MSLIYIRKPDFKKRRIFIMLLTFFFLSLGFNPDHAESSILTENFQGADDVIREGVKDAVDWGVGAVNNTWEFIEETVKDTYQFAEHALSEAYDFVEDAAVLATDPRWFAYKKYMGYVHGGTSGDAYKLDPYLRDALRDEYPDDRSLLEKVRIYHSDRVPGDGIASSTDAITDCARIYFNDWDMVNNVKDAADYTSPAPVLRMSEDDLKHLLHELTHVEQCTQQGGRKDYGRWWIDQLGWAFINEILLRGDFGNVTQDMHDAMPGERDAMDKAQRLIDYGIYARLNDSPTITSFVRMHSLVGINLCGGGNLVEMDEYLLLDTTCQGDIAGFNVNNIRQITADPSYQEKPSISGSLIVWTDGRNGDYDIYLYDLRTNTERQITANSSQQSNPAISGNLVVWEDYRNNNQPDIWLYDLTTNTEKQITTDSSRQINPAISGNRIVWEDYRNNNQPDIWLYDLTTGTEKQITTDSSRQTNPAISGNRIVWKDERYDYGDIYLYDLSTNTERRITTDSSRQINPAISGNLIVWEHLRPRTLPMTTDIYLYDLIANTERRIATNSSFPSISGDVVVWVDYRNGLRGRSWDLYGYDLVTNTELKIARETPNMEGFPVISGDKVVWEDYRNGNWDIYFSSPGFAPVFTPIGNRTVSEGQLLSFGASATDPDGETLTYTARGLPAGAAFNGQTFSWTPTISQAGVYSVTFLVMDSNGLSDSETIAITVDNVNRPPVLNFIGNKSVDEGTNLTFTISATDPDGDTLTYSATGLPAGSIFSGQTFSWFPTSFQAGYNYYVTFTVSDGSLGDSETVVIMVPVTPVPSQMTFPVPGGLTLSSSSVTFQWDAGTGVVRNYMAVGTTPPDPGSGPSSDIYLVEPMIGNSFTIPNIPLTGQPVYVRLYSSLYDGKTYTTGWHDYVYQTALPADLSLSNQTINSGVVEHMALNSITAGPAFAVEGAADVTFKAGAVITLKPGFRAMTGSKFRAVPNLN